METTVSTQGSNGLAESNGLTKSNVPTEDAVSTARDGVDIPAVLLLAAVLGLGFGLWAMTTYGLASVSPASARGSHEGQFEERETVLRLAPAAPGYLSLSGDYYTARRYEDSIRTAREVLKLDPTSADAWNNVAAGNAELKRWDEAIQAAEQALTLRPDFQLARNNLAWAQSGKAGRSN